MLTSKAIFIWISYQKKNMGYLHIILWKKMFCAKKVTKLPDLTVHIHCTAVGVTQQEPKNRFQWTPPPPPTKGGEGHMHSPAGEGVGTGESQFGRLEKKPSTLSAVLCGIEVRGKLPSMLITVCWWVSINHLLKWKKKYAMFYTTL
jgi:hypothetical protein